MILDDNIFQLWESCHAFHSKQQWRSKANIVHNIPKNDAGPFGPRQKSINSNMKVDSDLAGSKFGYLR
jgi:hypothetical protein